MMAARWRWSLVAVRSFVGVVYLSNGLAKLFDFSNFNLGPWSQYLINRGGAYNVIASNHAGRAGARPIIDRRRPSIRSSKPC